MKNKMIVITLALAITACASTPYTFEKAGVSNDQLARDTITCRSLAMQTASATSGRFKALNASLSVPVDTMNCMETLGYNRKFEVEK